MALESLPWELVEEILSRVPPKALVRFRTVCKQWNALFHEKRFHKTQLDHGRPQFILFYKYMVFLIDINLDDPSIKMRQILVDVPDMRFMDHRTTIYCDGLLMCEVRKVNMYGYTIWNPLLRQGRQIMTDSNPFKVCGIGYDNTIPEIRYKLFGYYYHNRKLAIYECESDTLKYINAPYEEWSTKELLLKDYHILSFNGNSYWIAYNSETSEYIIQIFDFSKDILKNLCILPCNKNYERDTHYLSISRGNRLSVLEQCYRTREIEIWLTKERIKNGEEEDVIWIKFMTVSSLDIPRLYYKCLESYPSYVVDDIYGKIFIMMCYGEGRQPCIYIARGGVTRKIKIGYVGRGFEHSVYVPSLIPIACDSSN